MKTYPLRTFVRRVLVVRLGIATAIIAIVVAVAAYVSQQALLTREVADLGRRGVATLVERVRTVMDRERTDAVSALREVLSRGAQPVVYRAGRFVLFQVYDRSSAVLAEGAAGTSRVWTRCELSWYRSRLPSRASTGTTRKRCG